MKKITKANEARTFWRELSSDWSFRLAAMLIAIELIYYVSSDVWHGFARGVMSEIGG